MLLLLRFLLVLLFFLLLAMFVYCGFVARTTSKIHSVLFLLCVCQDDVGSSVVAKVNDAIMEVTSGIKLVSNSALLPGMQITLTL